VDALFYRTHTDASPMHPPWFLTIRLAGGDSTRVSVVISGGLSHTYRTDGPYRTANLSAIFALKKKFCCCKPVLCNPRLCGGASDDLLWRKRMDLPCGSNLPESECNLLLINTITNHDPCGQRGKYNAQSYYDNSI
jgi:hypothetical protein